MTDRTVALSTSLIVMLVLCRPVAPISLLIVMLVLCRIVGLIPILILMRPKSIGSNPCSPAHSPAMETKDDMDLYPEYNDEDYSVLKDDCGEPYTPEDLPDDQYRSSTEDWCIQSDPDKFHENNIDNDTIKTILGCEIPSGNFSRSRSSGSLISRYLAS